MNFLSSKDIKQPSRQSQKRTKTFYPPKSIRPPPSNFPVNQKINNHKQRQHYSWILNQVFYFSQLLVLSHADNFCLKFSRKASSDCENNNDGGLTDGIIFLGCKKKNIVKNKSRGFILFQFYSVIENNCEQWEKQEHLNFSLHTHFFLKIYLFAVFFCDKNSI